LERNGAGNEKIGGAELERSGPLKPCSTAPRILKADTNVILSHIFQRFKVENFFMFEKNEKKKGQKVQKMAKFFFY